MSGSNVCRLCRSTCSDSVRLRDANCKPNEIYYITIKFFHPTFLNVDKDATNPLAVLCVICWHHISIFNNFQQTVLLLQSNLAKEAQLLKESNESQEPIPTDFDDTDVKNIEFIDQVSENYENDFGRGQLIVTDKAVIFETNVGSMEGTIAMSEGKGESEDEESQDGESHTDVDFLVADECDDSHNSDNTMDLQQLTRIASTSDNSSTVPKSTRTQSLLESDTVIAKWKPKLDCYVCSNKYTTLTKLKRHFQEEHPNDEFYILCCERKFKYRFRIRGHAILHMDPNAFRCTICKVVFKSKTCLQGHINDVHPEETLDCMTMCEICGLLLRTKSFRDHLRIHRRKNAHECKNCGNTFKTKKALDHHMKYVHFGKKLPRPRTCELCEKTFSNGPRLFEHRVRYHPETYPKNKDSAAPTRCDLCEKTCYTRQRLLKHRVRHHPEINFEKKESD